MASVYWFPSGGNDGTAAVDNPALPFETFAAALAAASNGDTIFVANSDDISGAGIDITKAITLDGESWGGGASAPTVIPVSDVASSGSRFIIDRASTTAGTFCIKIDGVANVTLKGVKLIGGEYCLSLLNSTTGLVGCRVEGSAAGSHGLNGPGSGTQTFRACIFRSCTGDGANFTGTTQTLSVTASSFYDNTGNGIQVRCGGTTTVDRCYVARNTQNAVLFNLNAASQTQTATVKNNILLSIDGVCTSSTGLVTEILASGTALHVNVWNNTLNNRNSDGTNNFISVYLNTAASSVTASVLSNVFINHDTNLRSWTIWPTDTVANQLTACNRNVFNTVSSNTNRWREGASNTHTFAQWQALTGTPDANSLNAAPGLGLVGDDDDATRAYYGIKSRASAAFTVGGTNLHGSGVTVDYSNRNRPSAGAWSAGAFVVGSSAGGKSIFLMEA